MTRLRGMTACVALLCCGAPAWAVNTASMAATGDGPGLTAVVGSPDMGLGARVPFGDTGLRLLVGTSFKPVLRAPQLDVGVGWRLKGWRFGELDVTPTLGLLVPTYPAAAFVVRGELLPRGMLVFRFARLWTGPVLGGAFQMAPGPRAELGGGWAAGASARWLWFELGVAGSLGARSFWTQGPTSVPDGLRPDARAMVTLDVTRPFRPTRKDLPWLL